MGPGQIAPTLEAMDAPHIRRAIDCFGADRVVWAADKTSNVPLVPWSDLLHSVRDDPELSPEERRGSCARRRGGFSIGQMRRDREKSRGREQALFTTAELPGHASRSSALAA